VLISRKRYKIGTYFQWNTNRKSYVAYRMTPVLVTLNDLKVHSPVVGLFKCNPWNMCAVFCQISTDSALARSLSDSWASCTFCHKWFSSFSTLQLITASFAINTVCLAVWFQKLQCIFCRIHWLIELCFFRCFCDILHCPNWNQALVQIHVNTT